MSAEETNASPPSGNTTPSGNITAASAYARGQVEDALSLCGYAVAAGVHSPRGEPQLFADIAVIHGTAARLGMFEAPGEGASSGSVTTPEWVGFEQAYYRLAAALSPVTAETLKSTQGTSPDTDGATWWDRIFGNSPALRFTRMFSGLTIGIAAFILIAECLVYVWGLEGDARIRVWDKNLLSSLLPWAYGALGSCAYLLRSAHYFIYQRSFDLRRKPEYYNRILLGAISGGAIILFVNYLVDDSGTVVHLSSAALGFVAGYSTDFLFNTIERVVAAIFPKTDSDPRVQPSRGQREVAKKPPPPRPPAGGGPTDASGGSEPAGGNENEGQDKPPPRSRRRGPQAPPAEGGANAAGAP
ncbi:hypothetical protein [Bradyrhizobium sp. CB3481]|uniref:hypothetical protein n=1 Tax=Bradyrhizobium sp. CB3481 TaxID=3039158 RepID=UPI0024B0F062|nr:hypothetical protein [Bradyrhizobium sp. CB3481]WFU13822.1 hypothetical protein QA643_21530 [Bradyrhizobium sp. CB3481]